MRYELDKGTHSVYALHHLVQVVECWRKVFENGKLTVEVSKSLKQEVLQRLGSSH